MIDKSVLFLGKKNDGHTLKALEYLNLLFKDVTSCLGVWGQELPEAASYWQGDIIISYLSRWVVPQYLLDKAKEVAVNFHPATPDYPGIGCINFAIYEDAKVYGSTCHHMDKKVDTGSVIKVSKFPIYPSDTVETLLARTYDYQLCLFYEIVDILYSGKELPSSDAVWSRKPFSRKEFDDLNKITPNMNNDEIKKRIRATLFKEFKPTIEISGYEFELKQ